MQLSPPPMNVGAGGVRVQAIQVSDLSRFLFGSWKLTKLGWDHIQNRSMRFHGAAVFSGCCSRIAVRRAWKLRVRRLPGRGEPAIRSISQASAPRRFALDERSFHTLNLKAATDTYSMNLANRFKDNYI